MPLSGDNQRAEEIIASILDIFEDLKQVKSRQELSPGIEVNSLFGLLVGLCVEECSRGVVENVSKVEFKDVVRRGVARREGPES